MNPRQTALQIMLCIALGFSVGCGTPSERRVISDFRQAHSAYSTLSATAEEGDADTVYYSIRYTKPNVAGVFRAEWMYQKVDGKWAVQNTQEPDVPCGRTETECR